MADDTFGGSMDSSATATMTKAQEEIPNIPMAGGNPQLQALQKLIQGGLFGQKMGPTVGTPRPRPTFQMPPMQTDQREFQTRSGNRRVALNNLMSNIANTVKAANDFHEQKKIRGFAVDFERAMTALQGLQQAQSLPDGPEKQQAMKHNQDILNDIFSDPKKVKAFEKALDIKLIGEDKNAKTPERQGLNSALEKFMKQVPQTLQPNPAYQAMAQAIKDKMIPSADTSAREMGATARNIRTIEGREKMVDAMAAAKDRATLASLIRQSMQNANHKEVAGMVVQGGIRKTQIAVNGMLTNTKWKMAGEFVKQMMKDSSGAEAREFKQMAGEVDDINKSLAEANKKLASLGGGLAQRWEAAKGNDAVGVITGDTKEARDLKAQVEVLEKRRAKVLQKLDEYNFGAATTNTDNSGATAAGTAAEDKLVDSIIGESSADQQRLIYGDESGGDENPEK